MSDPSPQEIDAPLVSPSAQSDGPLEACELSIVMPCLDEAETLATCIGKARTFLEENKIKGEVVIADNGSTDGSQKIAEECGARVVPVVERGYGAALIGGIRAARGEFIIMGDADDSYDFSRLETFVEKLREGYDLVMGNRFRGGIASGAMPWKHRYIGNPVLTGVGRLFFHSESKDFHCGLRGFRKDAFLKMDLRTTGMEFASEMVIKATLLGLKVAETPTTLSPDGRDRAPHLRSWRDGWRHLRFMLLFSPRWLFYYPGLMLFLTGLLVSAWILLAQGIVVGGVGFTIHTLLYSVAAAVIGYQAVIFASLAHAFADNSGLLLDQGWSRAGPSKRRHGLEWGVLAGVVMILLGVALGVVSVISWGRAGFGAFDPEQGFRIAIPAVALMILGCQTVFGSFFHGVLNIQRK